MAGGGGEETDGPDARRRRTERWFVHQGLPHFIEDYSVTGDVLTRALPFLTLVFVLEAFNTFSDEREGWAEVAPFFVGLAVLLGALVLVNRLRGRRPLQRPDRVGGVEIAVFLLVPPLLPAILHDDRLVDSLGIVAFNLVVLLVAYIVTSYGLLPMTRWGIRQLLGQFGDLANLVTRSLPLLLIFTALMFMTAEIWQLCSGLGGPFFLIAVLFPFLAGTLFLLLRVPDELDAVARFADWPTVQQVAEGTPVEGLDTTGLDDPPTTPPLGRRAWVNVGLVLVVSQSVQIVLVALVVGLAYVAFGLFAMSERVTEEWTVTDVNVIASFELFGNEAVLTDSLLKVAAFVAAFAGLQFTLSALTDTTYRQEFFERAVRGVRQALAVRALYLARLLEP
ncbi:MAG: hypothetical protein JNK12_13765 [Acidimicrobiales bacterium]|nr:hypothetical protein [Acidimicrobiales bacterium]